jgi:two-component system, chemotaxis family, CheB/CheR fusion protein
MTTADADRDFEALLDYLKRSRGFDFTGYKRPSLMRRVKKRMEMVGLNEFGDYEDYLEVHPDEFTRLFDMILINVTGFFRDSNSWDYVADEIVPRIIASKKDNEPIRVWSAGCASGEEAYTIAMVLAEALGLEHFRDRVKIYASDIDEEALGHARQASYANRDLVGVPPSLIQKYFEQNDHRTIFHKELRRAIIFGRHDLFQDAPISRIDLLVCRNTLMYFNAETQARILMRFHFALNDGGFLFLGKAEMLFAHSNLFTPVDLKYRIFTRIPKLALRDRLLLMTQNNGAEATNHLTRHGRFREAAFDASHDAQIVLDLNGFMVFANERARVLFGLTMRDMGRQFHELGVIYRLNELRIRIEETFSQRVSSELKDVEWLTITGELRYLEIQIVPLLEINGGLLGVSVTFTDMTHYKRLQQELERASQELETAYEELQSTNEELETTNEELQSTIEELETTNEELQSTNEELETINEEMHSTNEEMQTVNEEMRRRTEELNQVNAFLESILKSMRGGVIVLNQELNIQIWNDKAEDLWGLRKAEVLGKNFLNLDIGLPVERLKQSIWACLARESDQFELTLTAINRRGKSIHCKVICVPLLQSTNEVRGVILLMEESSSNNLPLDNTAN